MRLLLEHLEHDKAVTDKRISTDERLYGIKKKKSVVHIKAYSFYTADTLKYSTLKMHPEGDDAVAYCKTD